MFHIITKPPNKWGLPSRSELTGGGISPATPTNTATPSQKAEVGEDEGESLEPWFGLVGDAVAFPHSCCMLPPLESLRGLQGETGILFPT